ncbi:MAG: hypothetical protein HKN99_12110 [Winogradskyella sp.]|nr:hypothetical protein [Winogradskyella sp.]
MYKKIILLCTVLNMSFLHSQSNTSYQEISAYPEMATEQTVLARLIESLGFRYYWATEDLRETDLNYQISEASRTTLETVKHIYDLSEIIKNAALNLPNRATTDDLSYTELRTKTLENLKLAESAILKLESLDEVVLNFGQSKISFWNLINGPITDAVWHCGQISSFRRASGNPINSKINFFSGKIRD